MFSSSKELRERLEATEIVLDAVISLLHKKALITRQDIQEEITLRASTTGVMVGGIEYRDDPETTD